MVALTGPAFSHIFLRGVTGVVRDLQPFVTDPELPCAPIDAGAGALMLVRPEAAGAADSQSGFVPFRVHGKVWFRSDPPL